MDYKRINLEEFLKNIRSCGFQEIDNNYFRFYLGSGDRIDIFFKCYDTTHEDRIGILFKGNKKECTAEIHIIKKISCKRLFNQYYCDSDHIMTDSHDLIYSFLKIHLPKDFILFEEVLDRICVNKSDNKISYEYIYDELVNKRGWSVYTDNPEGGWPKEIFKLNNNYVSYTFPNHATEQTFEYKFTGDFYFKFLPIAKDACSKLFNKYFPIDKEAHNIISNTHEKTLRDEFAMLYLNKLNFCVEIDEDLNGGYKKAIQDGYKFADIALETREEKTHDK